MKKIIPLPIAIIIIIVCAVLTGLIVCQYGFIPEIGSSGPSPIPSKDDDLSKLDPNKPTNDCAGNYLYYRNVYEYANILEEIYDMYELKNVAISKGFEVELAEDWSYINNWEVDKFNEKYELGFELKNGDQLEKGPLKIKVSDAGVVKITGSRIVIKKTISSEEKYIILLRYEADYYLKQSIDVIQDGRCNFTDNYIKTRVKDLLKQLNLESEWVDGARVEVNRLLEPLN
jgi:hypothetical protein